LAAGILFTIFFKKRRILMPSYTKSRHYESYQTDFYDGTKYLAATMDRRWNTQPKPYKAPLDFEMYKWYVANYQTNNPYGFNFYPNQYDCFVDGSATGAYEAKQANNKAYGSLVDQLGNQSQWANNLIEAHDSISMIEQRGLQLARAVSNLRKGNIGAAISGLGHPDSKKLRSKLAKAKSVGDQWLELHFGWVPAIDDISNGLNTLSKSDFGLKRVISRSYAYYEAFNEHEFGYDGDVRVFSKSHNKVKYGCRLQTNVRISNPNAFLANQFGVANPLSVAWEAVPYSFVVDWFSNVGQCLNAMTDFMGLDMQQSMTTRTQQASLDSYSQAAGHPPDSPGVVFHNSTTVGFICTRAHGLPLPVLSLKPFKGMSVARGATAIALLLQKL
jgi:hypothetical protein